MNHLELNDAILEVHTYDTLKIALGVMYPRIELEKISLATNLESVVNDVVEAAIRSGWVNSLVISLKNEFPYNEKVAGLKLQAPRLQTGMYPSSNEVNRELIELKVKLFGINNTGGFFDSYEEHQKKTEQTLELLLKRIELNERRLNALETINTKATNIIQNNFVRAFGVILFIGAVASIIMVSSSLWNG
jgi:hypothetical protein